MRSRFLSTDYFFADDAVECLGDFVYLPLPDPCLRSMDAPSLAGTFLHELDSFLEFPCQSMIDKFPFERALSQFLSEVVPEFSSEGEQRSPRKCTRNLISKSSEELAFQEVSVFPCEGQELAGKDDCESQTFHSEITKVHDNFIGCKGNESSKILQFEIVEVDSFHREQASEHVSAYKIDDERIGFSSIGFGITLDMVSIEQFEQIPYQADVYKSLYLIENLPTNSNLDREGYHSTEDSCPPNGTAVGFRNLPEFEVCDTFFKHDKYRCSDAFDLLLPCLKECDQGQGSDRDSILKDFNIPSVDYDILNYSSVKNPLEKIPAFEALSLDHVIDMDMLSYKSSDFQIRNTTIYPMESSVNAIQTPYPTLQEIQILDVFTFDCFSVLCITDIVEEKEIFDTKNDENTMKIHRLYESIVSSELCLVDETFKSLPTPILCEDEKLTSLNLIVDDILSSQRLHTISAGDGIYLDWHLLTRGTCSQKMCSSYVDSLMTVEMSLIDPDQTLLRGESVDFDIKILDDRCKVSNTSDHEKTPKKLKSFSMQTDEVLADDASSHIPQSESMRIERLSRNQSNNRSSLLNATMSKSSDLNSFVNARRGFTAEIGTSGTEKQCIRGVAIVSQSSAKTAASSDSAEAGFHLGNVENHCVVLSDQILDIVGNIKKVYLAILKNETDLGHKLSPFSVMDDMELLKFPQSKMLELVRKMSSESEAFSPLIGLCVMKQLVYYLCNFGIHTAHKYMRKISQENEYLKTRLSSTYCLVEDARRKADIEDLDLHPALSIIKGILSRKNNLHNYDKTLVVADELFWPSLSRKLFSMKVKFHELAHSAHRNDVEEHPDIWLQELRKSILEALPHSNCFVASHEQVSETFPLNKFSHILEYGGSSASSRICNRISNLAPLPRVDFIKAKLDDHVDVLLLCEGVSFPLQHMLETSSMHIIDILRLSPRKEIRNTMSSESTSKVGSTSKGPCLSNSVVDSSSSSDSVIILNILKSDKEMIASRRSSYQKILEKEKDGIQVVERELSLPLDLILTASVCLMWYDAKSVRITVAEAGGGSQIPLFMETLATSILISVSFSFSCCILIFEGESAFLGAIMDFSDALYAAAASLDMHVQLFCSYSPESTDEIVLASINYSTGINKGIYPALMETETLAESFLTEFPSINTLSAHAILSSCSALKEFLHWTFEDRMQAVRKYRVPEESMALFSHLCRYGELGESKSGTTDCSSIDSDLSSGRAQYRRKRLYSSTSDALQFTTDDCEYFRPESNSDKGIYESSKQSNRFPMGNAFGRTVMSQKAGNFMHAGIDEFLGDQWDAKASGVDVIAKKALGRYKHVCEDLNGEVINWNIDYLDGGLQSAENDADSRRTETLTRKSQLADKYGYASARNLFPLPSHIGCEDTWVTTKQHYQVPEKKIINMHNSTTPKRYEGFGKENYPFDGNILGSAKKQKLTASSSGNLFTKGLSREQESTSWTAELLNGVQEKSKMKQKPPLSDTYLARPGGSKNIDRFSQRRSPSIIDSFRYRGTSRHQKTAQQKRQKNMGTPLGSSKEKKSSSVMAPSWTPTDKRARQNLSFTRYGQEKQSKLIWTNGNFAGGDGHARKRLFDET